METRSLGVALVVTGAAILVVGLVLYWGGVSWFGRLPGDIRYESGATRVTIPITSMVLLSLALTLVFNLLRRWL